MDSSPIASRSLVLNDYTDGIFSDKPDKDDALLSMCAECGGTFWYWAHLMDDVVKFVEDTVWSPCKKRAIHAFQAQVKFCAWNNVLQLRPRLGMTLQLLCRKEVFYFSLEGLQAGLR